MESTATKKKLIVGSYVVGGDSIYLSEIEPDPLNCSSQSYLQSFQQACKKLPEKLDCLVIVDHLLNDPKTLSLMYESAKEHASIVHVISPAAAVLQRAASHAHSSSSISEEKILILINIGSKYLSFILEKAQNVLSPIDVQMNSLKSLQSNYDEFSTKPVFCVITAELEKTICEQLQIEFPRIRFFNFKNHLKTLVVGGISKALAVAEPGKHLEIANFIPGIFSGNVELIKPCSKLPIKLYFFPSSHESMHFGDTLTIKHDKRLIFEKIFFNKNAFDCSLLYLLGYNCCGLMNIEQSYNNPLAIFDSFSTDRRMIQVWSPDKEQMGCFNFDKKHIQLTPLSSELKELISNGLLNDERQISIHLTATHCDLLTVLCDKKITTYLNGPTVSVTSAYVGLLQYVISSFKPNNSKLLFLIVTKSGSKMYALNQRSSLCYTITYVSTLSQIFIDRNILSGCEDIGLFYITEAGSKTFLFFLPELKHQVINFQIKDCDEAAAYGGAIFAIQNTTSTLTSPYVTFDPFFNPEENISDGLAPVSRSTSETFFEIEAFFHGALKSIKQDLFYGDIVAIIFRRNLDVFIYFFVHVNGKFLYKFDTTLPTVGTVTPFILHFADVTIIENYGCINRSPKVVPTIFSWPKDFNVQQFLTDLENDILIILDTVPYADCIIKACERNIYPKKIYETCSMIVEISDDCCKIVLEKDEFLSVSGAEYIPMYLSFSSSTLRFGVEALEDVERHPESVIYDFLKLLGATSSSSPDLNYKGELVNIDNADDPKLGYKVTTYENGPQIISPEIAMRIFLKKLVGIYERKIGKNVFEIKIRLNNTTLTDVQKRSLEDACKTLKKVVSFSRY